MYFLNRSEKTGTPASAHAGRLAFLILLVPFFFSVPASAQNCPLIGNSIALKDAVCTGTVGYLQGSTPTGGTGTYAYQWQSATTALGPWSSISPDGTFRDYAIPLPSNALVYYRRIAKSGTCPDINSNTVAVSTLDWTTPAAPTVTIVQPTCTTLGSITITNPAPGNGTTYSINGANYNNSTGVFPSLMPGTYSVTAKTVTGCVTPVRSAVLNPPTPPPAGTVSPTSGVVCGNTPVTLTATGGASYVWRLGGSPIAGAPTGSTYQAAAAGTYTFIAVNGICSTASSNSATITQEALPTGTISPASANICAGSSQLLTVSSSNGVSYQWFLNDIAIGGATSPTYNATAAGVYTVEIRTLGDCKARASNSVTLTVTPLPTGTITPASVSLCAGDSVILTATGGNTYQWFRNGTPQAGNFSASYKVDSPGKYAVDIFDIGGCKGRASNEAEVTVIPLPSASITPASAVLCPGDSVVLRTSGGTSYKWYSGTTLLANQTADSLVVKATGNYRAEIFSGNCKGSSSNTVAITQGTIPTGTITASGTTICPGNTVTLTATGGSNYQWFLNGSPVTGPTAPAFYNANQTGTYSVTIFNASCKGPASNTITITPSTAITFANTVTQPSCTSDTGTVTVVSSTGGTGSGYTYSSNNGASFQPGNALGGLAPGTYQIVVKDGAGCRSNPVTVTIVAFVSTLRGTVVTTPVNCTTPAGTATITATGGTPPYQYKLENTAFQSSNTFGSVSAGGHTYTVMDAQGCRWSENFTLVQINSTLAATATPINASCGLPNGAVAIQATGGQPAYTYALDNNTNFSGANTFGALAVGQHKVTVKDQQGCTFTVNFTVGQTANPPNLVINNPARLCPNITANLQATSVTAGSDAGLTFSYWTDAAGTVALGNPTTVTAGTYYIRALNGAGCSLVKPVTVSSFAVNPPTVTAPRLTACLGDSILLTTGLGNAYQWYRNDTAIAGATLRVYPAVKTGDYSVAVNDGNCAVKSSGVVKLEFRNCAAIIEPAALVPTAFTPNKNGANDVLRPVFYFVTTLRYFKVYNRWGQQVFETSVLGRGWDGTLNGVPQPSETYSWILECVGKNGETIKASGRSLLIR